MNSENTLGKGTWDKGILKTHFPLNGNHDKTSQRQWRACRQSARKGRNTSCRVRRKEFHNDKQGVFLNA